MNKNIKRIVCVIAAAAMSAQLTSCGSDTAQTGTDSGKLTYWSVLDGNTAQTVSNLGDTEFAKELTKRTGVQIEYQHPAQGQQAEKFNIMVAMGKLPDIIEYDWTQYSGGPSKALSDGIIQELNIKEDAPNLYAYIQDRADVDKMIKTDDGKYYGFPFVRGDDYLLTSAGPIVRKDWLDDVGLDVPETIDDWTTMLTAFKDKKGAKAPLSFSVNNLKTWGVFVGAYGIFDGLYVDNGTVKYGPMDDRYKDFLTQFHNWYEAGLLDADYATVDGATVQTNMLNGISGATYGSCGSGIGKWMAAATDPNYNLVGAKYPVLNRGDKPQFGSYQFPVTGKFAVISRDCKDKESALKLLDYGYSDEGRMLFNFGIEGESYNMVDGYPTYTDVVTKNPDGLSMTAALAKYARSHMDGAFVQDRRYMEQYANLPQQKEALENWMYIDMKDHLMPNVSLTSEQQTEIATLVENLNTYKDEMQAKFIMGVEPLSKFDDFRNELKSRGLEKYLQYEQEAYERYMAR